MFLEILREARIQDLTKYNIKRSWEKTGLFPFNPEVVIGSLPVVILQREEEAATAMASPPKPPSRPTTSGLPAPLIIETPTDVNSVYITVNASFKTTLDNFKSTLGLVNPDQDQ
jgi:capsular polysaccharide biosynthesis protein